jgi:hypothetical protein
LLKIKGVLELLTKLLKMKIDIPETTWFAKESTTRFSLSVNFSLNDVAGYQQTEVCCTLRRFPVRAARSSVNSELNRKASNGGASRQFAGISQ